jgi:hypothetical protein
MSQNRPLLDEDSHLSEEAVALYVDALKLNRKHQLPITLLEHVSECRRCKAEVMGLFSVLEDQKYDMSEEHPYFDKEMRTDRGLRSALRIAAMILVAIGVSVAIYFFGLKKPDVSVEKPLQAVKPIEATPDSTDLRRKPVNPETDGGDLYASRFVPSPNLEDLVGSRVRSDDFKAVSPPVGEVVKGSVLFAWEDRKGARFTLRILDNRERVKFSTSLDSSHFLFTGRLLPGLYYWKLEGKEELLHLGKFVVK